jgi:hypothetical protein
MGPSSGRIIDRPHTRAIAGFEQKSTVTFPPNPAEAIVVAAAPMVGLSAMRSTASSLLLALFLARQKPDPCDVSNWIVVISIRE